MPDARPLTPARRHGPIFIIGAMGSGTTLLRLMLDSHPHIAVPQETGFMRAYNAHRFIPFKWSGANWAKRLGWTRKELDEQLRGLYDTLFMRYAEQHGKRRWGEKTPLHTWHVSEMAKLFPDAVFVGMVRHPGGSVASNHTRWRHPLGKACYHVLRYDKEMVRQLARHPNRSVILRYEDLLLQPRAAMGELLDWLGEPWSDQVLEHHKVQSDRGGRTMVEGRVRVDDPIDASRLDKWTRSLDARERATVAERLGRIAEFFGYAMDDPAVLEPLNDRGSLVTGGAEVAERIDRFPDLDLRTRMPVPRFERLYHPGDVTLVHPDALAQLSAPPSGDGGGSSTAREGALVRAARPLVRSLPPSARRRVISAARRIGSG